MADTQDLLANYKPGKEAPASTDGGGGQDLLANYSDKQPSDTSSKIGGGIRAAASTILGAKLFVPTTVASGFYGIGKGLTSLAKGEGVDAALKSAQSGVEAIPGAINKAILTTPESQSYAEKVGGIINWPIEKSAAGWKGLAELATTGDITKASDVVEGKSGGSNVAVPIAGTLAEASALGALFGRPGMKDVPFRKAGTLDETIAKASDSPAQESRLVPIAEHGAIVKAGEAIGKGAAALRDKLKADAEARQAAREAAKPVSVVPPVAPISTLAGKAREVDPLTQDINAKMDALPPEIKAAITPTAKEPAKPIIPIDNQPPVGTEIFLNPEDVARAQATEDIPTGMERKLAEQRTSQAAPVGETIAEPPIIPPSESVKEYVYKSPLRPLWMGFSKAIGREYKQIDANTFSTDKPLSSEIVKKFDLNPLDENHPVNIKKRFEVFHADIMDKLSQGATEIKMKNGGSYIYSDNIDPANRDKYPYRITRMLVDGTPAGHNVFKNFDEIAMELWGINKDIKSFESPLSVKVDIAAKEAATSSDNAIPEPVLSPQDKVRTGKLSGTEKVQRITDEVIAASAKANVNGKALSGEETSKLVEDAAKKVEGQTPAPPEILELGATSGGKQPWEMTRAEYKNTLTTEEARSGNAEIDKRISDRAGIEAQEIVNYYIDKYKIKTPTTVKIVEGQKTHVQTLESNGKPINNIVIIGKDSSPTTIRHEIEHIIDSERGRISKQHFDKYEADTFAADYFHRSQTKQALSEGKPVPPEVLKDYPELVKGIPVKETTVGQPETSAPIIKRGNLKVYNTRGGKDRPVGIQIGGTFVGENFIGKDERTMAYAPTVSEYGIYGKDGRQIKGGFEKASEAIEYAKGMGTASISPETTPKAVGQPVISETAKQREARVFQETQDKFADEAASTETISEREARRKKEAITTKATTDPTRDILSILNKPKRKSDVTIEKLVETYGKESINNLERQGLIRFPGKGMAEITKSGEKWLNDNPITKPGPGAKTAGTPTETMKLFTTGKGVKIDESSIRTSPIQSPDLTILRSELSTEGGREIGAGSITQMVFIPKSQAVSGKLQSNNGRSTRLYGAESAKLRDNVAQGSEADSRQIQKIADVFGKQIIWVKVNDPNLFFNGAVTDKLPGKIFINVASHDPHLNVLGHELLHKMKFESPELYSQLRDFLIPEMQNVEKFKDALASAREQGGFPGKIEDSLLHEELLSEFSGEQFTNKKFWNDMAVKNPTLFQKVAQIAKELIVKVINALGIKTDIISQKFFKDINSSRKILADAMNKYAETKGAEVGRGESSLKLSTSKEEPAKPNPDEKISKVTESLKSLPDIAKQPFFTIPKIPDLPSYSRMKEALLGVVQSAADTVAKFYAPPKWDNARAIILGHQGQLEKGGFQGSQLFKYANMKFGKSEREAIANYVEAGGDPVILNHRADELQRKFPNSDLAKQYRAAANLSPTAKIFAENIRNLHEDWLNQLDDAGILNGSTVENFVKHIWGENSKQDKQIRALNQAGFFDLHPNLARSRIFQSYFEGEMAGFRAKDKGIGFLASAYHIEANKALSSRTAADALMVGKMPDGKPIFIPLKDSIRTLDSKQYRVVSADPNASVNKNGSKRAVATFETIDEAKKFIADNPDKGYASEPEAHARQAIFMSPNKFDAEAITKDGRAYRSAPNSSFVRNFTWQTTDINGDSIYRKGDVVVHPDAYHLVDATFSPSKLRAFPIVRQALRKAAFLKATMLSMSGFHAVQITIHGAAHKINPFNMSTYDPNNPIHMLGVNHGLTLGFGDASQLISEGLVGGGLIDKIPILGDFSRKIFDFTFKKMIPDQKITLFEKAYAHNKENPRYKNLSDDQIASKTADEVNNAFGGINWAKMGVNKTFQDAMRIGLLAPDFLFARVGFAGQAVFNPKQHTEQAAAFVRLIAYQYIGARILNEILDGDPHWETGKAFSVVYNGQEFVNRSVPGDMLHAWTNPRSFIYNRLSPTILRTTIEALTGRDQYGRERDIMSQMRDFFVTHLPIPIQGPFRNRGDQALWESAVSSAGLSTFKYKSAAQRELSKVLSQVLPQQQMDAEAKAVSYAKGKLKEWNRAGKDIKDMDPSVVKELNKLTPEQFRKAVLDSTRYTRFEEGLKNSSINISMALKVWRQTVGIHGIGIDPKERLMAEGIITKKYINAVKHSPQQIQGLSNSEKEDLRSILEKSQ